ncbi:MAG: RNA polymerase subunit sigma-70, partial [Actinobacteria bacterium]|nr:RNA polymerase subunit sigma-70 [Actinomycetota bacterium]
GDINSYFYDENGERCETELERRTIGMNLDQLRRVRYTIGVAGGEFKVDAIYSALKGKIVNLIVIDNKTAEEVLNKH